MIHQRLNARCRLDRPQLLLPLLLAALALAGASCSSKPKVTDRGSGYIDPEIEHLESSLKLVPKFNEEGVSSDRSSFETKTFSATEAFGEDRFDTGGPYGRKAFDGSSKYDPEAFAGADSFAAEEFEAKESPFSGLKSLFKGKKNVPTPAYDTGQGPVAEARESFVTGSNRQVARRRASYPEPDILSRTNEGLSVEAVRELLGKDGERSGASSGLALPSSAFSGSR